MATTKKAVGIALFAFWSVVTSLLTAGLVFYQERTVGTGLPGTQNEGDGGTTLGVLLTITEIAKHGSPADCWIVIGGKVYDVTDYIALHPGGAAAMTPYCGIDATAAFASKDKEPAQPHSQTADAILTSYYIGSLNDHFVGAPESTGNTSGTPGQAVDSPPVQDDAGAAGNQTSLVALTAAEIAKHDTTGDCWIIIGGKVYDVTNYFGLHPGGTGAISPYCGGEATQAFATKDKASPQSHSQTANNLLTAYYIGDVGQDVSVQDTQQPPANPPGAAAGGDDDGEDEEDDD